SRISKGFGLETSLSLRWKSAIEMPYGRWLDQRQRSLRAQALSPTKAVFSPDFPALSRVLLRIPAHGSTREERQGSIAPQPRAHHDSGCFLHERNGHESREPARRLRGIPSHPVPS